MIVAESDVLSLIYPPVKILDSHFWERTGAIQPSWKAAMSISISKSKYVAGLQCPKLLWTHYNDPKSIPKPDDAKEAIFKIGHEVGDLAKALYPDGKEVEWSRDLTLTVRDTADLIKQRVPIFEASFLVDGSYCRADILVPVDGGAWDLYEVKSATKVKDVNIDDVSFQADAIERSGLRLDRLYLMHLDSTYLRQGDVEPAGLFFASDVTGAARLLQPAVASKVSDMHRCIAGKCPATPIGEQCFKPYACDLWNICSAHLPEHSVLDLNGIRKNKAFALIDQGVEAIADLSESGLSEKHLVQKAAVVTGAPQAQADEIRAFLDRLTYPIYCLDFEAMNPAVPRFDGTRPYQHVPFQMSLHIIDAKGQPPRQVEYLAETDDDPRPGLIEALKSIGPDGSLLAFNTTYEKRIVRELARDFPDASGFLMGIHDRFEDLATPFSRFWYYDARQHGSSSLKAVLPVLTDKTYKGMEIEEGSQAMREFQRVVFEDTSPEEKDRVLAALREYCRQDTQAMVDILAALDQV